MKRQLRYSFKYLKYWIFAKHKKGHGIHSPFMFSLISQVFNNKQSDGDLEPVFAIYDKYKKSGKIIEFDEIGAGTSFKNIKKITIGTIIKRSSINKKYGQLIYRLIKYFHSHNIIELGTSVGISTAFIAQAAPRANFTSIEGIPEKIAVAKEISRQLRIAPTFIQGNFDDALPSTLKEYQNLDLVFIDGNHTKKATLNYFYQCLKKSHNESVFILDDIHWSKEMEEAWEEAKNNDKVRSTVDLFRMGLIFFRKELSCQHYVIKF